MVTEPGLLVPPESLPSDLVRLYRQLALHRQAYWKNDACEAGRGIQTTSLQIGTHPFWRTLPDPTAVSRAAITLKRLSVLPDGTGPRTQPYPPPETEESDVNRALVAHPQIRAELAQALDEAGLWADLTEAERLAERRHVELTGVGLRCSLFYRDGLFVADGEELSERGAAELLAEMTPALATHGLALDVVATSNPYGPPGGDDYVLEINGSRCTVWTRQEAEQSPSPLWYESTLRPFIVINELLESVGARARLYNEAGAELVFLMTREVHSVLTATCYRNYRPHSFVLASREHWNA
jgi:hypothetical protein